MSRKVNKEIDYHAKLRVFHGGYFKTVKKKTDYVNPGTGGMLMKTDMVDEVCYFNLMDVVKNELGYKKGHNKKGCKTPTQTSQAQVPQKRTGKMSAAAAVEVSQKRKKQRRAAAVEVSMSGPSQSSQPCPTQSSQASSNPTATSLA